MRVGKTLRINEELYSMIKELTQIYKNYYNYNRLTTSSIMEKLVVNGFQSYIQDLKDRNKENPEMAVEKIKSIEKKLHDFINNQNKTVNTDTKILSFITEEKLHECIDELATAEAKALQLNIGYTTLVTGMIVKGADFYIKLAEQYLEPSEIDKINSIRTYIDSLDLDLNALLKDVTSKELENEKTEYDINNIDTNELKELFKTRKIENTEKYQKGKDRAERWIYWVYRLF